MRRVALLYALWFGIGVLNLALGWAFGLTALMNVFIGVATIAAAGASLGIRFQRDVDDRVII